MPDSGLTVAEAVDHIEAALDAGDESAAARLSSQLGLEVSPALYAAAVLAMTRKAPEEAAKLLATAALLAPLVPEFRLALARAELACRRPDRCIDAALASLELEASSAACMLAAQAYTITGAEALAAEYLQRAVELAPEDARAWNALGASRLRLDDVSGAQHACTRALELRPDFPDALLNLGRVRTLQGQTREGLEFIQQARGSSPDASYIHSALLFALSDDPDAPPAEVFAAHQDWGTRVAVAQDQPGPAPFRNSAEADRKLRIGYVSADLRRHPVAFFTAALFGLYDHHAFEVFCYFNSVNSDQTTFQIRSLVDHWREIACMSDQEVANLVRDDQIDILVDLSGHTAGHRLAVFARRAAPIQVSYLGYPATTGLAEMDYRITDGFCDPLGSTEAFNTETLVRPWRSFVCYTPPVNSPPVAVLPALRNGYVTFGSFNRARKINNHVVKLWSSVLDAVPHSRLLLKQAAPFRQQLLDRFARFGAHDRIDFVDCDVAISSHLESYALADIALDTFPWNGITTTCEALWMGVPVVVLTGRVHRSRAGVSLLNNVGLPDFVAKDEDDFVDRAAKAAGNLERLAALRAGLRAQVLASPIMDAKEFSRALGSAYRDMWRTWCGGPVP